MGQLFPVEIRQNIHEKSKTAMNILAQVQTGSAYPKREFRASAEDPLK